MRKPKPFSRHGLLAAVLLLVFITNSCKKDALIKSDPVSLTTATAAKTSTTVDESSNITQKEIFDWVNNLGGELPFVPQWDKMQKGIFNGKYAIKVPIANAENAALFFNKNDGVINAFVYRWHNDAPGSNQFKGRVKSINLQTRLQYDLTYKDGKVTHYKILRYTEDAPGVATNSIGNSTVKTMGFWRELLLFIKRVICEATGGDWSDGNGGIVDGVCGRGGIVQVVDSDGGSYYGGYGNDEDPVTYIYADPNIGVTDTGNGQNYGGGSAWIYTPPTSYNSNDGCHIDVQDQSVNNKRTNYATPPPPPQANAGGCGLWTDYPVDTYGVGAVDQVAEGDDGTFDATYWDNSNLTFPPQTLPTFNTFYNNFPSRFDSNYNTPEKLYTSIGGQLTSFYYTNRTATTDINTCAVRVSKALNYSGIVIPNIPGKTLRGADNANYFLTAMDLKAWMIKTFGLPTGSNNLTGSQIGPHGENFLSLIKGKVGIYILTPTNPSLFKATGHADFLNYLGCDGGCYVPATGGVSGILIWQLH